MANAAGLINEGLWRKDKEFQQLPRLAQCTFCQILSQKDLDTAGVLTLHLELLAKACTELTEEQLRADFAVLEQRRFLFVDYDTDEVFLRSYVRLVSVKSPNAWRSVPKNARLIASLKIRHELALELRRIGRKDAVELADEIDPVPTPSQPPPDPIGTPSEGDTPSEPHRDPPSQVPVPYKSSLSVVGSVGERAHARPACPDHPENSLFEDCRFCMRRREWDKQNADLIAADDLARRRHQREVAASCPDCHGTNQIQIGDDLVRRCEHSAVRNA